MTDDDKVFVEKHQRHWLECRPEVSARVYTGPGGDRQLKVARSSRFYVAGADNRALHLVLINANRGNVKSWLLRKTIKPC